MSRHWYSLTDEEMLRLNPPDDVFDDEAFYDAWLPVGVVPRPRSRLGWFCYHLLHGLLMRYPLHKALGFALANTKPEDSQSDFALALELACSEPEFIVYQQALDKGASFSEAYSDALNAGVLNGVGWMKTVLRKSNTSDGVGS